MNQSTGFLLIAVMLSRVPVNAGTPDMMAAQFLRLNEEQKERFIQEVAYQDADFYEKQTSAKIRDLFSIPMVGGNFSKGVNDIIGITQELWRMHSAGSKQASVDVNYIIGRYIVKQFGKTPLGVHPSPSH